MSKRKLLALSALLPLTLALAAAVAPAPSVHTTALAPTDAQAAASRLVYGLLSDSRYAYRSLPLDDSLSADIFRRYLDALDPQKLYFTQADMSKLRSVGYNAPFRAVAEGVADYVRALSQPRFS